jgi:hypothetical protein
MTGITALAGKQFFTFGGRVYPTGQPTFADFARIEAWLNEIEDPLNAIQDKLADLTPDQLTAAIEVGHRLRDQARWTTRVQIGSPEARRRLNTIEGMRQTSYAVMRAGNPAWTFAEHDALLSTMDLADLQRLLDPAELPAGEGLDPKAMASTGGASITG